MTDLSGTTGPGTAASEPPRRYFGVDVGGTKIRTALASADGSILAEQVEPAVRDSAPGLVARIVEALARLRAEAAPAAGDVRVEAAGIALAVGIDPTSGRLDSVHNLPGLADADNLRADLEVALGMPVEIDNDANAAAVAEHAHGVARGVDDVAVIAIGTGIGLGLIVGGRLVSGARGMAGEIAFLPVRPTPAQAELGDIGPTAPGSMPAYEALVAGPGLRGRVDDAVRSGRQTRLWIGATLGDAVDLASAGDVVAAALVDEEARLVAFGIAAVVAVVDPELVVLSGGVGSVAGLLEPVRRHLSGLVRVAPRIETGLLAERGPLIGALEWARRAPRG